MKKIYAFTLTVFILATFSNTALAQPENNALVPLPSLDDFTKGKDGWAFGLGLGVEYETAYEGSDEFGLELQPAGAVQWRNGNNIFYFAGEAFGWRGLRDDKWLLEALLGFEEGREESDSDEGYLDGLGDQDEGFELVLQARRAFTSDWRYWLVGRVVTGGDGNLALFGVGRRFGEQQDGTGHEVNLVAVFHDSEYANKGFGIDQAQGETSGLDVTSLSGGLRSMGIDYSFRHNLNDNCQLYGEALFEYYSSEVRESPIARSDYETEIGIGVIYIF
ncbi:MAG: MipA/OmpV family protein [Alteromonadaceae bacterium TMED7]|nr:MAG: MipA/OmpV family protein [Alteromonadaceae bacterium TMED7]|tara:strand:+ start:11536 stop:12363 length:828 start_codon:yes stop_codon:yes gene_type:complete